MSFFVSPSPLVKMFYSSSCCPFSLFSFLDILLVVVFNFRFTNFVGKDGYGMQFNTSNEYAHMRVQRKRKLGNK